MGKLVLPPANICIYCQTKEHDGSREHIVPEGLGGRMELPKATCAECKYTINQVVEGPLLGTFYKRSRLEFGYKSKNRGRRQTSGTPSVNARNSWSLVVRRNVVPFEQVILIELPEHPTTYVQYVYPAPPFLLSRNPNIRNTLSPEIHYPAKVAYLNTMASKIRQDPTVLSVQVSAPTFRLDLVARLVSKIACGTFFITAQDEYFASQLGRFVIDGGDNSLINGSDGSLVFSTSKEVFPMKRRELRVFEVQENGMTFLYCAINLMPEAFKYNYFVRIPSLQSGRLIEQSWDYADPAKPPV